MIRPAAAVRLLRPLLLALALCGATAVAAAEIETRITPEMAEMGCTLRLNGPIASGDAQRLRAALAEAPPPPHEDPKADLAPFLRHFAPAVDFGHLFFTHRLCLNSPGGPSDAADELVAALASGAVRAAGGVPTAVARGDRCAGTCARVFLAGRFAFFPGHANYDGMNGANALLNPLGVLDLAGIIEAGPDALRQAARLLAWAEGWLLVEPRVLSEAMFGGGEGVRTVDLVGQAVSLGIAVEPNPLHVGVSPGDNAALSDNLCAHAAVRAPAFAEIYRTPAGGWRDGATGRDLDCQPGEGVLQTIRSFLEHPLDPEAPRPRLHTTCEAAAVFRAAGDCEGFACEAEIRVVLPCLAFYPQGMPLSDLAVPLPGR